ncbi:MAG: hypothetical protein JJE30_10090 [Desulfuromonadales bacterium]|nr:hypothetical protein [Desulfuromonadales bacterium]
MNEEQSKIILRKDKEWHLIDSELCLVTDFQPLMGSAVKDGKVISPVVSTPYAEINIVCKKIPKKITGLITHKEDFINLWAAFKERGVTEEKEEVLLYWSMLHYVSNIGKVCSAVLPSGMLPKIVVMVCPRGTYESCPNGLKWPPKEDPLVLVYGLESFSWWIPAVMNTKFEKIAHVG